ncbi:hypothetical protein BC826DRAFT_1109138 [Russula brevipes]|nr:hypothetical protein BC826DRAFT_1109138 [Russula brevipes]
MDQDATSQGTKPMSSWMLPHKANIDFNLNIYVLIDNLKPGELLTPDEVYSAPEWHRVPWTHPRCDPPCLQCKSKGKPCITRSKQVCLLCYGSQANEACKGDPSPHPAGTSILSLKVWEDWQKTGTGPEPELEPTGLPVAVARIFPIGRLRLLSHANFLATNKRLVATFATGLLFSTFATAPSPCLGPHPRRLVTRTAIATFVPSTAAFVLTTTNNKYNKNSNKTATRPPQRLQHRPRAARPSPSAWGCTLHAPRPLPGAACCTPAALPWGPAFVHAPRHRLGLHAPCHWGVTIVAVAWGILLVAVVQGGTLAAFSWANTLAVFAWGVTHAAFTWGCAPLAIAWAITVVAVAWGAIPVAVIRGGIAALSWADTLTVFAYGVTHAAFTWGCAPLAIAWAITVVAVAWGTIPVAVAWGTIPVAVAWGAIPVAVIRGGTLATFSWADLTVFTWGVTHAAFTWGCAPSPLPGPSLSLPSPGAPFPSPSSGVAPLLPSPGPTPSPFSPGVSPMPPSPGAARPSPLPGPSPSLVHGRGNPWVFKPYPYSYPPKTLTHSKGKGTHLHG